MVQPQAKHCRISQISTTGMGMSEFPSFFFWTKPHTHHTGVKIKTVQLTVKGSYTRQYTGMSPGSWLLLLESTRRLNKSLKRRRYLAFIHHSTSQKHQTNNWLLISLGQIESSKGFTATNSTTPKESSWSPNFPGKNRHRPPSHPFPDSSWKSRFARNGWCFRNPCNKPRNTRDSRTRTQIVRLDRI